MTDFSKFYEKCNGKEKAENTLSLRIFGLFVFGGEQQIKINTLLYNTKVYLCNGGEGGI